MQFLDLAQTCAPFGAEERGELAGQKVDQAHRGHITVEDRRPAAVAADHPVGVSSEGGTTGLALLLAARTEPALWQSLGLGPDSRVLLISSEGDTDPAIYREVVGKSAAEVCA